MTEQLLPCPFCGKTAEIHPSTNYHDRFYIECKYCLIRTDDCRSEEEAAGDWNARHIPKINLDLAGQEEELYIKLEEEDYLKLVSGGQVDKTDNQGNQVHIILADIGWEKMHV